MYNAQSFFDKNNAVMLSNHDNMVCNARNHRSFNENSSNKYEQILLKCIMETISIVIAEKIRIVGIKLTRVWVILFRWWTIVC